MAVDDFAPETMAVLTRAREKAIARASARGLHADPIVLETISQQVLDRLPLLLIEPTRILDLGCGVGAQMSALSVMYPACEVTGLKLAFSSNTTARPGRKSAGSTAKKLLSKFKFSNKKLAQNIVLGDPHSLPFDDGKFDLVVSNLCLPFCQNPGEVFKEVSRVLSPGGTFLFSSLGPDTLLEYRQLWASIDTYPHVSGLIDMHDLGDAMLKAGLADPVLDRDSLNDDYPSVAALEDELQVFGLVNMAHGRRKGLMTPRLASFVRSEASRFTVGLELVHGHAWKAEFSSKRHSSNEEFRFPVSELQGSWKR